MSGGAFTYERMLELWRTLQPRQPRPGPFDGMEVRTDYHLPQWETERVQFRVPRSKRRRIRRKWSKRARNWRTRIKQPPQRLVYEIGGALWMHPETWEVVKRCASSG